jgi:phage-related minor tail protein
MADQGVEYGIRITADGKMAIAESAKVEKALDGVAAALDHVEASATQAQPAIGATMKQFAPQPAIDTAKALGNAAGKFDQLQMSAAQTAQALRQVPMQFTDIFTSLAAGQPPMQVFLQQGGQLKDTFGGMGPAAKALGSYVLGLVNPLTVTAASAGVLAVAFLQGRGEADDYRQTLALTGSAAGVTADRLAVMAARLDTASGTQASNANILTKLAATGQVASRQIEGVAGAISAMTEAGISDTEALVKVFADIGKEPVKAILKVNEAYNFLTPAIYGQIKALEEQGKHEAAVALAQDTAAKAMKERAREVAEQAGTLERAWKGVTTAAREAWDSMLSIGRQKTLAQQIADQKRLIDDIREGVTPGRIDAAQGYLTQLEAQAKGQEETARTGADAARNMREYIEVEGKLAPVQKKGAEQTRSLAEALKEYRDNLAKVKALDPSSALLDPAKVAAGEAALREQYKPKKEASGRKDQPDDVRVVADWQRRVATLDAQAVSTDKLSETERAYVKVLSDIESGHVKVTLAGRRRLAVEASHALALDEQNRKTAEQARQAAEQAKWSEASVRDTTRETKQIADLLDREQEQVAAIGLTKEAVSNLAVARLRNEAAARAEYAANLELAAQYAGPLQGTYLQAAEEARKQADLLNRRAENRVDGASREAADATAKRWEKVGDDIERSLTDSLYRGFESGKNFGQSFVDAIQNTLKTTVLKMVIQAYVEPVTQAARSFLGAFLESAVKSYAGSVFGSSGSSSSQYSLSSGTNMDSMGGGQGMSFGGGRAGGGAVSAGTFYEVNESGPELLTTGGRTFLMMGSGGGQVTPASSGTSASAASAPQTFRVEIHNDGTPQEVTGAMPRFDAEGTVVQIFTRDLQRNGPIAQSLTAFKSRR